MNPKKERVGHTQNTRKELGKKKGENEKMYQEKVSMVPRGMINPTIHKEKERRDRHRALKEKNSVSSSRE